MGQKLALLAGVAIGFALARLIRRGPPRSAALRGDPRAGELRQRLESVRALEAEERGAPAHSPAPEPQAEAEIEEARRSVYEEGQAAIDEMRRAGDPP